MQKLSLYTEKDIRYVYTVKSLITSWCVNFTFMWCIFVVYNLYIFMQKFQGGKIGTTLIGRWFVPLNEFSELDKAAAKRAFDFFVGWYI